MKYIKVIQIKKEVNTMTSVYEVVANQYFDWCDKMSQTKFTGSAVCPADGQRYWFVLGMICDSYEEYERGLNQHFGCDL